MTTSPTQPLVFISYRIADTKGVALRLADDLRETLELGDVFLDRDTIEAGENWRARLADVARADVVLALIGRRWLTEQDEYGRRRLDREDDWVRREIATALRRTGRTIPVLVDGAKPVPADALSNLPDLRPLADQQGTPLRLDDWERDVAALIGLLDDRGFRRVAITQPAGDGTGLFASNVRARGNAPFVGRAMLLSEIENNLGDTRERRVLVLRGQPGVGKSELALEYARRQRTRYPGGTFFVDAGSSGPPVDLAWIGRNVLGLPVAEGLGLRDQCVRALLALGKNPTLLILDNVPESKTVTEWLPPAGMPCHVLLTTTWEDWDASWRALLVPPLGAADAIDLVAHLSSRELADQYGIRIIATAGGLPVQICPSARQLGRASRRGRLASFEVTLAEESRSSFAGVWNRLDADARFVMLAAAMFSLDRIPRDRLCGLIGDEGGWSSARLDKAIDACLDTSC